MHILMDPLRGPLFTYSTTYSTTLGCSAESIRRESHLVPTVVNTNSNPTPQLSLCAGPVTHIRSATKHKKRWLFFANPYPTDGYFS